MNRIGGPVSISFKILVFFVGVGLVSARKTPEKDILLTKMILSSLANLHYSPRKLDDAFSQRAFDLFLKKLDPQKRFLTQSDVDSLGVYRLKIDDELRAGTYDLISVSSTLLDQRISQVRANVEAYLKTPINFKVDESLELEPEKLAFSKDDGDLGERWRKVLKYQVMTRVLDLKEETKKPPSDGKDIEKEKKSTAKKAEPKKPKTEAQLEKEARESVAKNMKRFFDRMREETQEERVVTYLNAVANSFDPHSEYFKPQAKEEFDITMTGKLEGIGAVLREEDGFIKVMEIVPGSASWRQKDLKAEDKILKVAQGAGEPIDIVDVSVNEAVRLIRGKKGTEVRLTVQKPGGEVITIPIIRDVVVVEESYAKSAVLADKKNGKTFGYITLPTFYHDFKNKEARSSSEDVKRELDKLRAKSVDGIILDLRNNGGGALDDAVKMAGLFIRSGPVVQVKDPRGPRKILYDKDTTISFDGPVVVLVNSFSASASEIVAAALQDYGRAVILGNGDTFGKGTVQTMMDLDNYLPPTYGALKPLGSMKVTFQKFYRINGGSTQYRGVTPDITIPDAYSQIKTGEKTLDHALAWDTVPALSYLQWPDRDSDPDKIRVLSRERIKASKTLQMIEANLTRMKRRRENTRVALHQDSLSLRREAMKEEMEKLESLQKELVHVTVLPTENEDASMANAAPDRAEKTRRWHEQLVTDIYVDEALSVLGNILVQ